MLATTGTGTYEVLMHLNSFIYNTINLSEGGDTITIRELSNLEIEELDTIKNFKEFGPVECNDCSFKGSFIRRLFHVENIDDDSDREITRWHLK